MSSVDLLFCAHNHQPVGNFEHVLEDAYKLCYKPQIDVLEAHPGVRIALHYSGPLLEWIEGHHPGHIDKLAELAERGQVEMLSGGFYEPILPSIPEDDAIGQIVMMNDYIKKRFGMAPTGMWTAERIWDPNMPRIIAAAGLNFTVLDDTHFYYTGLGMENMFGYYVTEKHGAPVAVFPIDKTLRYTIPFRLPHESIDYIRRMKEERDITCVTYGDDGEKFGVWPGTHQWVIKEKWLHKFYTALEEDEGLIKTTHFSEYLAGAPPLGRVYLPQASYEEMTRWALPAGAGAQFEEVLKELERQGRREEWKPFIRGGIWDSFLAKYDESNRMHKKMLYVSDKINAASKRKISGKALERARRALYMGQCNCAYWHGLFGGLYLGNLRHAIYERLIEAENIIDSKTRKNKNWIEIKTLDFDMDKLDEVVVENPKMFACFDPDYGGSLMELDFRPARFSLTNTLTRRYEAYHEKKLIYDRRLRRCFLDRFFSEAVTTDDYKNEAFEELGDFSGSLYDTVKAKKTKNRARLTLSRLGSVNINDNRVPVRVTKSFTFNDSDAAISAEYSVVNEGDEKLEMTLGVELNLTLLAGNARDRYWTLENVKGKPVVGKAGKDFSVSRIGMRDDYFGFQVVVESSEPFDAWRFPVETASRSESGVDWTYQGSCVVILKKLYLGPAESMDFDVVVRVSETG